MRSALPVILLSSIGLLGLAAVPLRAEDPLPPFPPVTDEERAIASVLGEPNAPAVVLFKKGEFLMMGYGRLAGSASHLRVRARVKVLTEAGKSNGEIVVAHSDFTKLESFEGRTVLPDGRVLPLPRDARFLRKTSLSRKTFATAVSFPGVEVGAILDYQYELVFKSPFLFDPWYFAEEVPVRYSEILFKTASGWQMRPWSRTPFGLKIQQEQSSTPEGEVLRAWAENVPAVPSDPYGPPYGDLAAQMMLLPVSRIGRYGTEPLFDSWSNVSWLMSGTYAAVWNRDFGVAQQARKIAGSGTDRQKAEALYHFVRDEIETQPEPGIFVDPDSGLRKVLADRRGTPAEKALLLQTMFRAVDLKSTLIWARDRDRGEIDFGVANPTWFDAMFLAIEPDGNRAILDPADRALAFGEIRPAYEGTAAVIPDIHAQRTVRLPETPFDENGRRAEIDLALDEQGRLTGQGSFRLTGHHAREKIEWEDSAEERVQAWKAWLAERFHGFEISGVEVAEASEERRVVVSWSMSQREEEVLGDETSLTPGAPFEPVTQPLVQPSSSRKTMVMFDYADRDEMELRLRWPEHWKPETLPAAATAQNEVGAFVASVEPNEGGRSLIFRRRFDLVRRTLRSPQEYEKAQLLFATAEKSDAQTLVLVRE